MAIDEWNNPPPSMIRAMQQRLAAAEDTIAGHQDAIRELYRRMLTSEHGPAAPQYAVLPKALSAEAIAKLPVDLAEAIEQCKLAIIRHRSDDWHEIEAKAMKDVFRALAEYTGI